MKKNENSTTSKQFKNPIENSQKHGNLYSQHTYIYTWSTAVNLSDNVELGNLYQHFERSNKQIQDIDFKRKNCWKNSLIYFD
jgi:CMP-N-acetylneuraminic acid synthetase